MGEGNDWANNKEYTGIHLIEVDASKKDGWSFLEIGFVLLALKLLISNAFHYMYFTKHILKKKVAKAVDIAMLNVTPPVVNINCEML